MSIDLERLPKHVAIIMDGNGRWAKKRKFPISLGHNKGMERLEEITKASCEIGIEYLTFYAFSTENWNRDAAEVKHLMSLVNVFYKKKKKLFIDNDIKFVLIGSRTNIPKKILDIFEKFELETKNNKKMVFNLAFNYGSRLEIVEACNNIIKDSVCEVDENIFSEYLYTRDQKDVDLMIRTSGEMRLSNFLLWQNAYSEFVFVDTLWPDFDKEEYIKTIEEFQNRDRRFGKR